MSFFYKKVICSVMLFGGVLIGLSPFLFAAITGNEDIIHNNSVSTPLILIGLGLIIAASVFQKHAFCCPACKQRMTSHMGGPAGSQIGGLLGITFFLRMKECPHCHTELR